MKMMHIYFFNANNAKGRKNTEITHSTRQPPSILFLTLLVYTYTCKYIYVRKHEFTHEIQNEKQVVKQ